MDYSLLEQTQSTNQLIQQAKDSLVIGFWVSVVITVLFLALFIVGLVRKWKVQSAVLDMRKMLSEMNERDKARDLPATQQPTTTPRNTTPQVIAAEPNDSSTSAH